MPTINFKGKTFVQNHHLAVPFHKIVPEPKKSVTDSVSLKDNLIIHGDNLLALKALLPTHAGKIQCIYIDPPYNTGNEGWVYNDNVKSPIIMDWIGEVVGKEGEDLTRHDKWLCMMMPRLKILRELLADDGVIFISCDDNEMSNLRVLMDEIFGSQSYLTESPTALIWARAGTTAGHFSNSHEYILAYAKKKELVPLFSLGSYEESESLISDRAIKAISKSNPESIIEFPEGIDCEGIDREYKDETIGGKEKQTIIGEMVIKNGKTVKPFAISAGWAMRDQIISWMNGEITHDSKGQKVTRFYFNQQGILWYEKERGTIHPRTILPKETGTSQQATAEQIEIFGKKVFDYTKPAALIKYLLSFSTKPGDIILDSFAGSGTTAQAVLELNKEDGGNRKFILVEMEDYADFVTAERVRRVIAGVPNAKNELVKTGLGGSFSYFDLGEPIEMSGLLSGDSLPSYEDLARYVFYVATGEEFDATGINEEKNSIGVSSHYDVYMYYKPDVEYLKETALTLDAARELRDRSGDRPLLVFAPTKYVEQTELDNLKITFCQLPFEIYKVSDNGTA